MCRVVCPSRYTPVARRGLRIIPGIRMLYCFNPAKQNHAYINADTDTLMSFEEAQAALMM